MIYEMYPPQCITYCSTDGPAIWFTDDIRNFIPRYIIQSLAETTKNPNPKSLFGSHEWLSRLSRQSYIKQEASTRFVVSNGHIASRLLWCRLINQDNVGESLTVLKKITHINILSQLHVICICYHIPFEYMWKTIQLVHQP